MTSEEKPPEAAANTEQSQHDTPPPAAGLFGDETDEAQDHHDSTEEATRPIDRALDASKQALLALRKRYRLFCRWAYLWLKRHREMIMIGFTAVTAMATWAGVWVSQGQLEEIRNGAADTEKLVTATRHSAIAAQKTAVAMEKLRVATENQAVTAKESAVATNVIAASNTAQLEMMGKQVDTSQKQADVLTGQLQIARERLEIEKTGELDISPREFKNYKVGGRPTFTLAFENVGYSQTIEVRALARWEYVRPNEPSSIWAMFDKVPTTTSMIIPIDKPKGMPIPSNPDDGFLITQENYVELSSGKKVLRVVAVAEFVDATGKTRRRHFCYSWWGRPDNLIARFCATPKVQDRGQRQR